MAAGWLAARLLFTVVGIALAVRSLGMVGDYPLLPVSEPLIVAGLVYAAVFAGVLSTGLSWLLPVTYGIAVVASAASTGQVDILGSLLALGAASVNMVLGRRVSEGLVSYKSRGNVIAGLAGVLLPVGLATLVASTFYGVSGWITEYFTGLPGDVGVFYGYLSSTALWRLVAYSAGVLVAVKLAEVLAESIPMMVRGGRELARYEAEHAFKRELSRLVVMRGRQYSLATESFIALAAFLVYPVIYGAIGFFLDMTGIALDETLRRILMLLLALPTWLLARAVLLPLVEPPPMDYIMSRRGVTATVVLVVVSAGLFLVFTWLGGIDAQGLLASVVTGRPYYEDPYAGLADARWVVEGVEALGRIIDEGARLVIDLLWGG
ncbi:MAG: hypothetical protein GSR78_00855 [Desulfurococcales archaeon]|nr:hypothetical protein [Desulfurococcales archaeon]